MLSFSLIPEPMIVPIVRNEEEGWTLPMKEVFAANVPVFTGKFRTPMLSEPIAMDDNANAYHHDIWRMAQQIADQPLWDAQVDQMVWAPRIGWVMYPRMGGQIIRFGEAQNFDLKMNNLFVFYSNTLPHIDLEQYDTLDARFANQICLAVLSQYVPCTIVSRFISITCPLSSIQPRPVHLS